jgi:hypothetical protein
MLLSSAICRLLCLLLCGVLCNMSLQPGRYSLVSLTDLTSNRCTDVYWYMPVSCRSCSPMQLSAAICRLLCCCSMQGLCNMSTQAVTGCKVCFTDPTHQNNRAGNSSVLLSSYCADAAVYGLFCSEYCCMHRVCASRKSDRY